jgi:hypothetical protein
VVGAATDTTPVAALPATVVPAWLERAEGWDVPLHAPTTTHMTNNPILFTIIRRYDHHGGSRIDVGLD